jgi:ABC-type phosphate transport system auxiliary subunit
VFDLVVHRPDLPLFDNTDKVGLGLWNLPIVAFALEAALLFGGIWLYLTTARVRRAPVAVLGLVMLAIQAYVFFGPPPVSDRAAAWTALAAYAVFVAVVARLERPHRAVPERAA